MIRIGVNRQTMRRRLGRSDRRWWISVVVICQLLVAGDARRSHAQLPRDVPLTNLVPVPQHTPAPPPSGYNSPLYDTYSSTPGAGTYAPAVPGMAPQPPVATYPNWLPGGSSQPASGGLGGLFSGSPVTAAPTFGPGNPGFTGTPYGQAGLGQTAYGNQPYAAQPYGTQVLPPSGYPPEAYPSPAPNTLFPGGIYGGGLFNGGQINGLSAFRIMQGPRMRHGWIRGGDGAKSLQMNETDLSVAFAFPNFLYSGQPAYVAPSFGLNLLAGPHSSTGADLPGQVYSAYLDSGWQSDPNQMLSVDLGLRVGVFSDFDSHGSDSIRVMGRGLAHFRLSPFSTFKGGVYYIDRERADWLPAVGILYQPTPTKSYDIFFPEPKLSHYLRTLGTQDVWGYVAGEYGGGAWTVRRESGQDDYVDISDFRLLLGLEWGRSDLIRQGRRTGFFEVGYVFDRELYYKRNPQDNISPNDTIMLRVGLGY